MGLPTVALDFALDAIAASTWYIGLIVDTGYTGLAAADTMGSHAGWTESTDYAEATRPGWAEGASSGQSVTNATPVSFTSTATQTIKGFFITSVATKGGSTGTLLATRLFTNGERTIGAGQQLTITPILTARDATP